MRRDRAWQNHATPSYPDPTRQHLKPDRVDWLSHGPLGYANANQSLGRSAILGGDSPQGTKATLLFASANAKGASTRAVGDSAASAMCITTTYELLNDVAQASPPRVVGKLQWGTDGHQAECYFDWVNGTTIQVSASSCEVSCELVAVLDSLGNEILDPDASIRVGAFVGYWESGRRAPTFTQQVKLDAPSEDDPSPAAMLAIPRFARGLTLYGSPADQTQWAIGPQASLVIAPVDLSGVKSGVNYLRPGAAQYLYLEGNTAPMLTAVWELAL